MTQTTAPATLASRTIAVEHVKISSERSFAEVRRRLEDTLPKLDASIAEVLRSGDQKRATEYEENGPKLSMVPDTARAPSRPRPAELFRHLSSELIRPWS